MTHSETVGTIAAALAKAQKSIEGAAKDARNPHFNAKYADLASIVDACKDPLADNEIAVLQSPASDGPLVRMTTLLLHSSGEWIESDPLQVQARDAGPQAVGSCLTYLRRYQLAAMVGVAPEDDDAESGEGRSRTPGVRTNAVSGAERRTPPAQSGGDSGRSPSSLKESVAPSSPNVGASKSAVLISDFRPTPTQNPSVTKYTLTIAGGPDWPANQTTVSTINSSLAFKAETHYKNKMPVFITTKQTAHGFDLVSIAPAEATA